MLVRIFTLIFLLFLGLNSFSQQIGVELGGFSSTDHMTHTGYGTTEGIRVIIGNGIRYDLNFGARLAQISFVDKHGVQETGRYVGWKTLTIPSKSQHAYVSSRIYWRPIGRISFFVEPELGVAQFTSSAKVEHTSLSDRLLDEVEYDSFTSSIRPTVSFQAGVRYYLSKHITFAAHAGILGYNYKRSVNDLKIDWIRKIDIRSFLFSLQAGVYINLQENYYRVTRCHGSRAF